MLAEPNIASTVHQPGQIYIHSTRVLAITLRQKVLQPKAAHMQQHTRDRHTAPQDPTASTDHGFVAHSEMQWRVRGAVVPCRGYMLLWVPVPKWLRAESCCLYSHCHSGMAQLVLCAAVGPSSGRGGAPPWLGE